MFYISMYIAACSLLVIKVRPVIFLLNWKCYATIDIIYIQQILFQYKFNRGVKLIRCRTYDPKLSWCMSTAWMCRLLVSVIVGLPPLVQYYNKLNKTTRRWKKGILWCGLVNWASSSAPSAWRGDPWEPIMKTWFANWRVSPWIRTV